jgi:hypothetical protein
MIVLAWRFWTAAADGDAWFDHCDKTALQELTGASDNRGVFVLWRNERNQTEFVVLSFWEPESRPLTSTAVRHALASLADDGYTIRREIDPCEYEVAGRGAMALTAALSLED